MIFNANRQRDGPEAFAAMVISIMVQAEVTNGEGVQVLTVAQTASFMGVAENTVYNWLRDGRIPSQLQNGVKVIPMNALRPAKLLRETEVLDRLRGDRVEEKDIATAVATSAASPTASPDARYSLLDCDAIVAVKTGTWKPPEPEQAIVLAPVAKLNNAAPIIGAPADFLDATERWPALVDYIVNHGDPAKLPPQFWDTRDCPEFVPPAGVFHYTYWRGGSYYGEDDMPGMAPRKFFRFIRSSAGYAVVKGRLVSVPEDEEFDTTDDPRGLVPPGAPAPEYAVENARYRQLRLAWEQAFYRRRRQLRGMGISLDDLPSSAGLASRNRLEIRERYHREGWGPSDLPDWFWDAEECPPFEPPNGVARYTFSEYGPHPLTGEPVTFIRRTGTYGWMNFDYRFHYEEGDDRRDWQSGFHELGTRPSKYEDQNRDYDVAEHEWREEFRRRSSRRKGD